MARLPVPGADADNWGALLNDFLRIAHREDGTLHNACAVINVHDFGAIGDGNADDSTAIQAALDACIAAGGGEVCFPEGVYKVNRVLSATFAINAHITLRGMKRAVLDMTSVTNNATQT